MRLVRGSAHRQHHSTIREAGRAADAGARLPGERPGVAGVAAGRERRGAGAEVRLPGQECRSASAEGSWTVGAADVGGTTGWRP
jgi:hypothetical protein